MNRSEATKLGMSSRRAKRRCSQAAILREITKALIRENLVEIAKLWQDIWFEHRGVEYEITRRSIESLKKIRDKVTPTLHREFFEWLFTIKLPKGLQSIAVASYQFMDFGRHRARVENKYDWHKTYQRASHNNEDEKYAKETKTVGRSQNQSRYQTNAYASTKVLDESRNNRDDWLGEGS